MKEFQRQGVEILTAEAHDWGPDGVINATPAGDPLALGCPPKTGLSLLPPARLEWPGGGVWG